MAVTDFSSAMDAGIAAMAASDYSGAKSYFLIALAYQAKTPDAKHGSAEITYQRQQINDLIAQCSKQIASTSGLQSVPIKWSSTSS